MASLTKHSTHTEFMRSCSACRWEAMTPEEKEQHRARRQAQWAAQHPERAARRAALIEGLTPEPCGECQAPDTIAVIGKLEDGEQVLWRCRPCIAAFRDRARQAWLATQPPKVKEPKAQAPKAQAPKGRKPRGRRKVDPHRAISLATNTPRDPNAPEADAYLMAATRTSWAWVIRSCPFCGRRHQHGGGSRQEDPRDFMGGRITHCSTDQPFGRRKRSEYILRDADPVRTQRMIDTPGRGRWLRVVASQEGQTDPAGDQAA